MTTLIEADETWRALLDRVLAGENVTLTRDGAPQARVVPVSTVGSTDAAPKRKWTAEDFRARRVRMSDDFDAVRAVREMRDEGP